MITTRIRLQSLTRCASGLVWMLAVSVFAGPVNVLFIIVDDLRPQLGCYGDPVVKTPNIDRLASRSLQFNRAYAQQAVCSPSRNSFLSGLRPETSGLRGFGTKLRDQVPDVVTLPQHFKQHGYTAVGIGKVFHFYAETGLGSEDDPLSWSQPLTLPSRPVWGPEQEKARRMLLARAKSKGDKLEHSHDFPRPAAWERTVAGDADLQDGEIADQAIRQLLGLKGKPFFLAVGFMKPHLPFVAPRNYWDLYAPADIRLPDNQLPPVGAPVQATPKGADLRRYDNIPKAGPLAEETRRNLVHGYLASVSYVDAQVGRLLGALDALKLAQDTIVVLFGDHGIQVGEHGSWTDKHSHYETSTRVPLLVSAPGMTTAGQQTEALVELVDLYPTLADVCGLPAPAQSDGLSFKPLLTDPLRAWKAAAFFNYGKGSSLRTERWRFTEWNLPDGREYELYDHAIDPGENHNLANQPGHAQQVKELLGRLQAGWRAALPR